MAHSVRFGTTGQLRLLVAASHIVAHPLKQGLQHEIVTE
jgi:hypothetical protein